MITDTISSFPTECECQSCQTQQVAWCSSSSCPTGCSWGAVRCLTACAIPRRHHFHLLNPKLPICLLATLHPCCRKNIPCCKPLSRVCCTSRPSLLVRACVIQHSRPVDLPDMVLQVAPLRHIRDGLQIVTHLHAAAAAVAAGTDASGCLMVGRLTKGISSSAREAEMALESR